MGWGISSMLPSSRMLAKELGWKGVAVRSIPLRLMYQGPLSECAMAVITTLPKITPMKDIQRINMTVKVRD
jgi:hypothetical protein